MHQSIINLLKSGVSTRHKKKLKAKFRRPHLLKDVCSNTSLRYALVPNIPHLRESERMQHGETVSRMRGVPSAQD